MTIGTDSILSDDFVRADNTATLGASYTVQCADGTATTFGVVGNKAQLTSGGAAGVLSWAKISSALFGAAPQRVKVCVNEGTVGAKIGALLRLTTSGNVPTCYFLGKEGSGAFIKRYDAGTVTDLVGFAYVGAWDGTTGDFFLQLDADTDGSGNVVLTVSSSTSENGTYTQRATYTDSSASKITGAGTAAIATATNYNGANLKTWDYIRVIGTAASAAATLSVPTPSGTLSTSTTATIGGTTDQASGTGYGILSTVSSQVTSATAPQIKAGQINTGAAAPFAATQPTISTTSISIPVTGLAPATTYYYAIVQNNSNGDSNIVTGSFTTAAAAPSSAFNFDCASTGVAATTFAVDAGSSRVVVAVLSHEQTNGTRPVASLVVGGATFQKLTDAIFGQGTSYAYTEIWYCLESSIASIGANPSVTVTATSTGNKFVSGTLFTIANVQQSAASWVQGVDAKAIGTDLSATLATVIGRQIVGGATATIGGNAFTAGASVTEITGSDRNFNSSASRAVSFYGVASGTSTTVTTGNTNSNTAMSQSMVAVAFPALSGRSIGITLRDAGAVGQPVLNNQTRKFWTRSTLDGAVVDGGSTGISITCGTDGVFILSGLTIAAGAGYLTMADPADPSKSHNFFVTYV